jgi:hypothetical protein
MKIDKQKSLVYRWEQAEIAPKDTTKLFFFQVEPIVKWIWKQEGLQYPPLVEGLPKNCRKFCADATRLKVRFADITYTWIILHELAHSMIDQPNGLSNQHGSLFVEKYCQLLSRYLLLDYDSLVKSAREFGLRVVDKTN